MLLPMIAGEITRCKGPDVAPTVVRRSDSSGNTFLFPQHLATVSFKPGVGVGTTARKQEASRR